MKQDQNATHVRLTVADLRSHIREIASIIITLGALVVCLAALSIAVDIHAMRVFLVGATGETKAAITTRFDDMISRTDRIIEVIEGTNKMLTHGMTQVRVQVDQSSKDQARAMTVASSVVKEAAKQAQATTQLAQAVADTEPPPKPVINVEAPRSTPSAVPPIVVTPPLVAQPAQVPPAQPDEPKHGPFHWVRRLWPFGGKHGGDRQR